jgi:predicted Zn-dependent peptidase
VKDKPDVYAIDVLSFMLGKGRQSLLRRELVDKQNIAIETSVDFLTQRNRGLITVYSVLLGDKVKEAKAQMLQSILDVQMGKFTLEDLNRAKSLLINTFIFQNETNSGKADALGFYETIDDSSFAENYVQNIQNVKSEDVIRVAQKYLGKQYISVLVGPNVGSPKSDSGQKSGRKKGRKTDN